MAAADANLVWSPLSNLILYGATTDVPGALAAGVNVSLAPDWTESGANDLLAEMKVAKDWSDSEWGGLLDAELLAEMVTVNAAVSLGMRDIRGAIEPGLRADLMVIPGAPGAAYEALLESHPVDVQLTVISGRPGYGEPALMDQFPWLTLEEDITIAGETKSLALAIESHAIDFTDMPFSEVMSYLETAYDEAEPQLCCFRGLEVSECDQVDVPDMGPTLAELAVYPNPFNPQTRVSFTLQGGAADATIAVYGIDGRLVRELVRGSFAPGEHGFTWDGRDRQGRELASGVYLVRLEAGTTVLVEKAALVR
jgi:hypothetical protein